MKLTIIGCSGSMSGPNSAASCYLVQAEGIDSLGIPRVFSVVFDLGPGAFGKLWNYVDPTQIDAVVLSHLHADHCADLISMQVHRRWFPSGSLGPVPVYAPQGVKQRVRGLDGFSPRDDFEGEFRFEQLKQGLAIKVGPLEIIPFAAWHSVSAFAFRITGPSEKPDRAQAVLTYTGDTDECDTIVQAGLNSDLLLCECGFTEGDKVRGIHLSGVRAGRVAQYANTKFLVLTHIQPWTDPMIPASEVRRIWPGKLDIAQAGRTFNL